MIGPLRQPPCWETMRARARALAARAADLADACGDDFTKAYAQIFADWAGGAEKELVEATGAHFFGDHERMGLRGREPRLVWRSILPERPPN